MDLEDVMLREMSQSQRSKYYCTVHSCEVPRVVTIVKSENSMEAAWGQGGRGESVLQDETGSGDGCTV